MPSTDVDTNATPIVPETQESTEQTQMPEGETKEQTDLPNA